MTRALPSVAADASPLTAAEAADLLEPWRHAKGLLLAVSGGADSMAMLGLVAEWVATSGAPPIAAATVDHGLRPDARREADLVAAFCAARKVAHTILPWSGEKPRSALQSAAREARYRLLRAHALEIGAGVIAVAHSADDQAETVLMRLCAGSGITGLGGMRASTDFDGLELARPFLSVPRARLRATCGTRGWPFVDDPSNEDPAFGRVRMRAVLPLLADQGLTSARVSVLARRWREADEAVAAMAARLLAESASAGTLSLAALRETPFAVACRALGDLLVQTQSAYALPPADIRLHRLESLARRVLSPAGAPRRQRFTLAGLLVETGEDGLLHVAPAPPRRGGGLKS